MREAIMEDQDEFLMRNSCSMKQVKVQVQEAVKEQVKEANYLEDLAQNADLYIAKHQGVSSQP